MRDVDHRSIAVEKESYVLFPDLPYSILYKMKLPFIVVLNKTDTVDHSFAVDWMNDFEIFQEALEQVYKQKSIASLVYLCNCC